jgi:hypothetical protein
MNLALVTTVTATLKQMCAFYQEVLQIEPQVYHGTYVEYSTEAGLLALWSQSGSVGFRIMSMRFAVKILVS